MTLPRVEPGCPTLSAAGTGFSRRTSEQQFRALTCRADAGDELRNLREHLPKDRLAAVVGLAQCGQLLAGREERRLVPRATVTPVPAP